LGGSESNLHSLLSVVDSKFPYLNIDEWYRH
jgi:hypothetical protein